MKTSLVKTVLSLLIMLAFGETKSANFGLFKKDTVHCLKIVGNIPSEFEDAPCYVELISYNEILDSVILDEGATQFKFLLKRNTSYTIRITREGFATKLVCINTNLPDDEKEMFKFIFTTKLMKEELAARLNQDALDFPVALIYYDLEQQSFDNDKHYTMAVKRDWHQSKKEMSITPKQDMSITMVDPK